MHAGPECHRHRARPGAEVDAERGQLGLDVQAPPGREVAGRHRRSRRPTSSPRWSAWSRPATRGSRASSRRVAPSPPDPNTVDLHARRPQRQLPVPGLGVQRPVGDHPGRLRRRARPWTRTRTGPGPGSWTATTSASGAKFSRNDDWWGGKTPLDATEFTFFDDTGRDGHRLPGRPGRRDRPVRRPVRRAALRPTRTSPSSTRRRPTTARSGCAATRASSPTSASARRFALTIDRPALIEQLFKGKGDLGNDHVIAPFYPYFERLGPAAGAGHREGQAAAVGRRRDEPDGDAPVRRAAARSRTWPC